MGAGIDAFHRAMEGFEAALRRFPDDRWTASTPCDPWTTREVAGHVIGGVQWAAALISGSDRLKAVKDAGFSSPASLAEPDPLGAWIRARSELRAAVSASDPERRVSWPFGEQTIDAGLEIFSLEVLIHTWDLAQASGADVRLDPQLVHEHLLRLRPLSKYLRGPGMYGPEKQPPPGADEQVQLLAFLGREAG